MNFAYMFEIASKLLGAFIFFRFTDRMLHRKYPALFVYFVMVLWYEAEAYVNINLELYKVFPQSLLFFLNGLAINFILFKSSKGKKFLTALFLHVGVSALCSYIFIPFISLLSTYTQDAGKINDLYDICNVLIFAFAAVLLEFVGKKFENLRGNLPFDCCLYLFVLTVFISQSVVFICDSQQVNSRDQWPSMLFSTFCAITGTVLIIFSIHYVDKRVSLSLAEQQNTLLGEHIVSLKNKEEATASLRHDMKNHLLCLGSLMESGHYKEAESYLAQVTDVGRLAEAAVSTGNIYVDAILKEKKAMADQYSMSMEIDMLLPAEMNLSHFDLCIILSNALDNALEACRKITDCSVGQIDVSSYIKQGFLVLVIGNTTSGPVNIVGNSIESTKPDKHLHGIGFHNIKAAVLRLGGNLKISASDDYFTLNIVLPL